MDTQHEQYGRENEITEATWASLSAVFGDSQLRQVFGSPSGHPTTTPPENFEFTDPESEFFECIYREDTEKLARLLSRRKCLTVSCNCLGASTEILLACSDKSVS